MTDYFASTTNLTYDELIRPIRNLNLVYTLALQNRYGNDGFC